VEGESFELLVQLLKVGQEEVEVVVNGEKEMVEEFV
jgi:hypothetical protein